jgi:hypothetical protein
MRCLAIVLCLASSARADLAAAPGATGTSAGFPATDGALLADRPVQLGARILIDVIDLTTSKRTQESFWSRAELNRRFATFEPMRERVMLTRNAETSELLVHAGRQSASYDPETSRLSLRGPVRRTLRLIMRDTCFGEPRQSTPEDLSVLMARDVVLIEGANRSGSCMCEDRSLRTVVTAARRFAL